MKSILTLILLFTAQLSFATGGTNCQSAADDYNVEIYLLNSHTPGSSVLGAEAHVVYSKAPHKELMFTAKELVGWWHNEGEMKMHFVKFQQGSDTADTELIVTVNYSDVHETYVGMSYFRSPKGKKMQAITHCEVN